MLSYEEYVAFCQKIGAVVQGKLTNWVDHCNSMKAMSSEYYREYADLAEALGERAMTFTEDWVGHSNVLEAIHLKKFGSDSTIEPINERPRTALEAKVAERYQHYVSMCKDLGLTSLESTEAWGEHYPAVEGKHKSTYGDQKTATVDYAGYLELCKSVSHTPYEQSRVHWALHARTILERIERGELQTKAPDISNDTASGGELTVQEANALPAASAAPETASLSWAQYVPMALSTESIPPIAWAVGIGGSDEEWPNTVRTRMVHVATGLMSESIELEGFVDLANRYEEMGDCYWYLAVASSAIGWQFDWVKAEYLANSDHVKDFLEGTSLLFELRQQAQRLQDHVVQKHIIYGRPMVETTVKGYLDEIAYTLVSLNSLYRIKLPQLLEANIKKLAKRYPDGHFDTMRAAPENRDTQNELSHMVDGVSSLEEMWDTAKVVEVQAPTSILWTWDLLKKGMPFECDQAGLTVDTVRAMITQRLGNDGMFSLEDIQEALGAKLNHCSVHFNWAGENLANVWVVENEEGSTPCILLDPSNLLTPELFRVRLGQLKSPDTHANLFAIWAEMLALRSYEATHTAMAQGYTETAKRLRKSEPNYDEGYELYRRLNPTSYRIEDLEAWLLK